MVEDKIYCMSSFLMYRKIMDENKCFSLDYPPAFYHETHHKDQIYDSNGLYNSLKKSMENVIRNRNAALMLSGGIDSAILASFMPEGSTVYTLKCVVPGVEVIDETKQASLYAEKYKLNHKVIEIYWEDFLQYANILMKHKGAPLHSIEIQIYKAALRAKYDGFDTLIFGESADLNYGGLSGLLSRDWTIGEFIERYSYVLPYKVLKNFYLELRPYKKVERDGFIDVHAFCRGDFYREAMGSYENACETAGIRYYAPYSNTFMASELDYQKIRSGENKYIVRETFQKIYGDLPIPPKLPMPRPMNEWLKGWNGPKRNEFWPNCHINLTGDQKWLVYILERFLDMLDDLNSNKT